ncbi:MAG: Uncharacterized protein Greene07144_676 [Parcubacteria group bacterium Greene0714_4]|nr:MAG: Uncharacterized protein Greene101415_1086 [Parcubacteria group bacterium Greene1014_15]TSD07842.1 MAG: Uncharacterized protein Greene07144_676 [Parcubacteria group bacterium Greene0714_4]
MGMGIRLHIHPKEPGMTWKTFCETMGPYAIALDGYVAGGPEYDKKGPRASFNDHENVDSFSTRSTCGQIYFAIRRGLFRKFKDEHGQPHADLYMNGCDEDIGLSCVQLKHSDLIEQKKSRRVDPQVYQRLFELVMMEDALDTTCGAYPLPLDYPTLERVNWVFDPFHIFRLAGKVQEFDAHAYRKIIDTMGERSMEYIHGRGGRVELDMRFEVIGGGPNWSMVRKIGAQARTGMFAKGIHAYVMAQHRGTEQRWDYSLGRTGIFDDFDLLRIYRLLNQEEGLVGNPDCWGGGNTKGGSARFAGSKTLPARVEEIINRECTCREKKR